LLAAIYLAISIKGIRTPLQESFHLGSAIVIYIMVKLLIEVFGAFLDLSPDASFALKVYGELFSSIHAGFAVNGHIVILLLKGRGDDTSLLKMSMSNLPKTPEKPVESAWEETCQV
jgi:hypothetical protein